MFHKLITTCIIALITLPLLLTCPSQAGTFYVDSNSGSDTNPGTAPNKAWATLDKVNSSTFQPGDRILFKTQTTYTGQLKPKGSGDKDQPIIIDTYGTGQKPRIDGKGIFADTLLLENVQYWHINNLEITNLGPERANWRTGVRILARDSGTLHHIHLKNLYVHDVNGSLSKSTEGCGIFAECKGREQSRFDGLVIENCRLLRTDRNGICMKTPFISRSQNWYPSLNVVIRNNLIEDCGGDCIKPWGCDGCLVEHNTVRGGRTRCDDYAAGIWPWSCDNTLIQYNEVSGMKGTKDGQAFDSDYNSNNTTFQYNYSHDNDGGFMLVCSPKTSSRNCGTINTVIRYNISRNDGSDSRIFHISGAGVKNTRIHNNIIFVADQLNNKMVLFADWGGSFPANTHFFNNIFYVTGQADYELGKGINTIFENNVFYGNHKNTPKGKNNSTADPQFVDPAKPKHGFESLTGYKLQKTSPCRKAGIKPKTNAKKDFYGNKIDPTRNPDIGVHQSP